jgi:hypothetical protein
VGDEPTERGSLVLRGTLAVPSARNVPLTYPPARPAFERSARLIVALVRAGRAVRFRARGSSMWPAIPSGSMLLVLPCPAAMLRVGQVAAFERRGQVVVHRVQRIGPEGLYFAGDALKDGDGCVERERILGRVHVIERRRLRVRLPRARELSALWRVFARRLGLN